MLYQHFVIRGQWTCLHLNVVSTNVHINVMYITHGNIDHQ